MPDLHVVDLISQREAVRRHTIGWPKERLIAWLATQGRLEMRRVEGQDIYFFESPSGPSATFFLQGDTFVFVGDHHTFI